MPAPTEAEERESVKTPTGSADPLPDKDNSPKSDQYRRWWLAFLHDWFENLADPEESDVWEAGRIAWLISVLGEDR